MEEQVFIEDLVTKEIIRLSEKLEQLEPGTDEYAKVNNELIKLTKEAIEMEKFHIEQGDKAANRESDRELKLKQMKGENASRWIGHVLAAIGTLGSMGLYVWCANKSWRFEETGTITNTPGRKSIGNLLNLPLFKK